MVIRTCQTTEQSWEKEISSASVDNIAGCQEHPVLTYTCSTTIQDFENTSFSVRRHQRSQQQARVRTFQDIVSGLHRRSSPRLRTVQSLSGAKIVAFSSADVEDPLRSNQSTHVVRQHPFLFFLEKTHEQK